MSRPPKRPAHLARVHVVVSGRPPKRPVHLDGWPEPMWWCSCCGEPLPESRFGADKRSSNGLKSWCMRCVAEDRKMRRAISGEAAREWNRYWDKPSTGVDENDG